MTVIDERGETAGSWPVVARNRAIASLGQAAGSSQ